MKKVLAILLAVLTVFSFCAVAVSAEGEELGATGTVYKIADAPRSINNKTEGAVTILQDGDVLEFGALTAKTKTVEIVYHPDAAEITATNIKNDDWKTNMVPKYNLDTKSWTLAEGQKTADLLAKSPNYYKSFVSSSDFVKGDTVSVTFTGLKAGAVSGRDSANIERGVVPIDYALEGAEFVGWALYKYGTWKASDTKKITIDVYALWNRDAGDDEKEDPDKPGFEEGDDPIVNAKNKILYYIDFVGGWISAVPALLNTALALVLNTGLRNLLYKIFGIEA